MSVNNVLEYTSSSPEHTQHIAATIANHCQMADCITLSGELGAGKTCFAQGFITALTNEQTIQSPTFLLVKSYEYGPPKTPHILYHMDFYRIEHTHELDELGLEEHLQKGICLIEWPTIAEPYLPTNRLDITIEHLQDNQRKIHFSAKGDWQKRLNNVYLPAC